MIKLTRNRDKNAVHKNFFGDDRIKINLDLLKKKRNGELDVKSEKKWKSSIWKQSKTQLLKESNNKCAYCESPTRVVSYGDVEHFRPKSIYWWLAYCYENYLLSCAACNQEYKKDFFELKDPSKRLGGINIPGNFSDEELNAIAPVLTVDPVNDNAGQPLKKYLSDLKKEGCLLINPYFDDPAKYFAYQPILKNSEVVVIPKRSSYAPVVNACEKLFGINRKELLDLRYQAYAAYITFRHVCSSADIPSYMRDMAQERLREMASDEAPYAGMVRYFDTKKLSALAWNYNIVSPDTLL